MNYILIISLLFILIACSTVPNSINEVNMKGKYKKEITPSLLEEFDPLNTRIGKVYKEEIQKNPNLSGATLIENGLQAFLLRSAFAKMATKTIEVQTYIYNNDPSSRILLQELQEAAERGVKVKILVDDNGMDSDLSDIMLLDLHKNIEVKVFNTFKYRNKLIRYPQFLFDFNRLNSRMHNKMFVVDGVSVILGGRNIAENYFDFDKDTNFSDTDVIFIGEIAKEAQKSFYEYWNYHLAIPASLFPGRKDEEKLKELRKEFIKLKEEVPDKAELYEKVMNYIIKTYENKKFKIEWGKGSIIADSPEKIDKEKTEKLKSISPILKALEYLWVNTKDSIYISSAYFVPGKLGTEQLKKEAEKGININIITNSLSSTDAIAVYSAWEKYRNELVESGINVYEFKNEGMKREGKKISSFASLHSKTMVFDEKISWIGSFNLDPRSALLNSEIVAVFESKNFAKKLVAMMEKDMKSSWKLEYINGKILWIGKEGLNEEEVIENKSPNTTLWKRFITKVLKIIPETLI